MRPARQEPLVNLLLAERWKSEILLRYPGHILEGPSLSNCQLASHIRPHIIRKTRMIHPNLSSSCCLKIVTFTVVFLWMASYNSSSAKIFTRCQLSKELIRYSFPRSTIASWVCILENESGRMTNKVTHHPNGTSYGLFQINSSEWCKKGRKGGHCSSKCEDLLNDELSDDVRCAKRIFDRQGFFAWPSYKSKCKGKPMPDISRCP